MRRLCAVIPTYFRTEDDWSLFQRCYNSLKGTAPEAEIVICDDASGAEWYERLKTLVFQGNQTQINSVISDKRRGYSATVNKGLRVALENDMDAVTVNADIEFSASPDWARLIQEGDEWVRGAKLLYPANVVQHAGIYFSVIAREFDHMYRMAPPDIKQVNTYRECPVTGALMFIRHECLEEVGLMDEKFTLGMEEIDYCQRVFNAGEISAYDPRVVAYHKEMGFRRNTTPEIEAWRAESLAHLHIKYAGEDFSANTPTMLLENVYA